FPAALPAALWIGVAVDDEPEMQPRKPVGSVPYAIEARRVGGQDLAGLDARFVNEGQGDSISAAMLQGGYKDGSAFDGRFVNEGQGDSISAAMLQGGYKDGSAFDGRFVNEGQGDSISAAMLQGGYKDGSAFDGRFVNEGQGDSVSGAMLQGGYKDGSAFDGRFVNEGQGDSVSAAMLQGGYKDGSAFDGRFVNEGQGDSVSGAMLQGGYKDGSAFDGRFFNHGEDLSVPRGAKVSLNGGGAAYDLYMPTEYSAVFVKAGWFEVRGDYAQQGGGSTFKVWNDFFNHELLRVEHDGDMWLKGAVTENSSIRNKTNVRDLAATLPGGAAVDVLDRIAPRRFDWRDLVNPSNPERVSAGTKDDIGLIAEELRQVLPEAVSIGEDGQPNGIRYSKVVTLLLAATRELRAGKEATERRVEALERRIRALEASSRPPR
ncbi:MAG: tail fiber domain-containing protein, partial [Deltaproteobacteria bacterium]|nr:tail fiber domain-containing protein [Deltaproteobacteria bacterium]